MILTEKYRQILEGVLAKSRRDEAQWQKPLRKPKGPERTNFILQFNDESPLYVGRIPSPNGPDVCYATLIINGMRMAFLEAEEGAYQGDWDLLSDLFREAERVVYKWDKAVLEIDRLLESEELIGGQEPPESEVP